MSKELFIVEGKSAASTVMQALNKRHQEVFALQGKIINAEKAPLHKVLANVQCQRLLNILQCGSGEQCDPLKLPYSHLHILFDPDIDGTHARILLIRIFQRLLMPLIDQSMVSLIAPPLYRLTHKQSEQLWFAWNDQHLAQLLEQHGGRDTLHVSRLKGIAQLNKIDCAELLLHPDSRKQLLLRPSDVRTL